MNYAGISVCFPVKVKSDYLCFCIFYNSDGGVGGFWCFGEWGIKLFENNIIVRVSISEKVENE